MTKELGKISSAKFGFGGYQDCFICLTLGFSFASVSCHYTSESSWAPSRIKRSDDCKWTEEDRDKSFAKMVREIDKLLADAKCESVEGLVGKPIEAVFDGNKLESFRILTEVL